MKPDRYWWQKLRREQLPPTYGGNVHDVARNYSNRSLSDDEVMVKVKDSMRRELAQGSINQDRSDGTMTSDWNKLLETKLFNNAH